MEFFLEKVLDGKEVNMKNPKCRGAILTGIMMWLAGYLAVAEEYHYPDHLPQRTLKFRPYEDYGNGNYHIQEIELEPMDLRYFQSSQSDCALIEFHYQDKGGNDCRGKDCYENIQGKGGNFSRVNYKEKGRLGEIDSLSYEWRVVTNIEDLVSSSWVNRFYLENPQVGDVTRCYLLYNMGDHSWVSQEFGVRCGGKGLHAHCSQCFMPVTVQRNKTLAEATAERLKNLERVGGRSPSALNIPTESTKPSHASHYEIVPCLAGWHAAKADAEARGGHLATITSEEEWERICQLFSPEELKGIWLGATDENSEGTWQWVTGESFSYARWAAGEPNNWRSIEHFLGIQLKDSLPWNDYPDTHKEVSKYLFESEGQSGNEPRPIQSAISTRPVPPNAIDITEISELPESGTPELLRKMTDTFVGDIGRINSTADAKHEQLTHYVVAHLDEELANARQKGDYENSIALMKYKDQFDTLAESDNPTIKNFIAFRAKKSADIEKARVTYALQATQTFYTNLEQAKRTATKNANMDSAMAFAEHQKKVKDWACRLSSKQTGSKAVAEKPRQAASDSQYIPIGRSAETAKPITAATGSGASEKSLPLGNGVVLQMVHCPEVSPDFWIGKYEVTQEQWMRVMHSNPSVHKDRNNPVDSVTWEECIEFAQKLNKLTSLRGSGFRFRLPTCEEWKKACRAPATRSGAFCRLADGTEITAETLDRVAWYGNQKQTSNVGCLEPNAWGLYDMLGNVWEWNQDETPEKKHTRIGGSITDTAEHSNGRYYWHTPHGRAYPTVGVRIAADWKAP